MFSRFIYVVDNFYPNPGSIRRKALDLTYSEPEGLVGWRTRAYHPTDVRRLIERKFKVRIKYWEVDLSAIECCNGVFFSAYSKGTRAETVGVHYDEPVSWVMLLVYLTPDAPPDSGTSFWKHRRTGLVGRPSRRDAERLGVSVHELEDVLLRDAQRRPCWIETDRVGNVFNRALMFPSGMLHSASRHFGSNRSNGRLYQSFHFPLHGKVASRGQSR